MKRTLNRVLVNFNVRSEIVTQTEFVMSLADVVVVNCSYVLIIVYEQSVSTSQPDSLDFR